MKDNKMKQDAIHEVSTNQLVLERENDLVQYFPENPIPIEESDMIAEVAYRFFNNHLLFKEEQNERN